MDKDNQKIAAAFASLSPESRRTWNRRVADLQTALRRRGAPLFGDQSAREVFVALIEKGIIGRGTPRTEGQ